MESQLQTQAARYPVKSHVSGFRVLCEFARIFLFYRAFSLPEIGSQQSRKSGKKSGRKNRPRNVHVDGWKRPSLESFLGLDK